MHKLVSHDYFMNELQITEVPILTKYLNYSDVISWSQTRELMLSVLRPYLKKKDISAQDLFSLPTDEKHEKITEVSKKEVEWFQKFKESYENKESN